MSSSIFNGNAAAWGSAIYETSSMGTNDGKLRILDKDLIKIDKCCFENNVPDDRYRC